MKTESNGNDLGIVAYWPNQPVVMTEQVIIQPFCIRISTDTSYNMTVVLKKPNDETKSHEGHDVFDFIALSFRPHDKKHMAVFKVVVKSTIKDG